MALTGAEKWGLEKFHDMSPGHIDLLDRVGDKYPDLKNGLTKTLFTNKEIRGLRDEMMEMLRDDKLVGELAKQVKEDPGLLNRVNHLIENEPQKLQSMIPQFKENPKKLAAILNEAVTPEQAKQAEATASAQQQADNPLAQLKDFDFSKIFGALGENFSMENIGQVLLSVINGIYGMVEGLAGGLINFSKSKEVVVAGNGGPNGPLAQAKEMTNAQGATVDQKGNPLDNDGQMQPVVVQSEQPEQKTNQPDSGPLTLS